MIVFAKATFDRERTLPDGSAVAEHLASAKAQLGKRFKHDEKLEPSLPVIPAAAAHVWIWFNDLRRRIGGGFSPMPISWPAIQAWRIETKTVIRPWELEGIMRLDDEFLRWMVKQRKADDVHG